MATVVDTPDRSTTARRSTTPAPCMELTRSVVVPCTRVPEEKDREESSTLSRKTRIVDLSDGLVPSTTQLPMSQSSEKV